MKGIITIRVLIPFPSSLFKILFWFTFLLNANAMIMMLNDMVKHLITLLQKWDVTGLPPLQESRPEILNRREKGGVLRS